MGSFSIWHLFIAGVVLLSNLLFIPVVKKAGLSGWWAVLTLFPGVGFFVAIWLFAFARWPAFPDR